MNWNEILSHYPEVTGIHPAADLFPLLDGEELSELCRSIKRDGLDQPITIWTDGTLLDGRNRLIACYRTNQEVVFDRYSGPDPVEFSIRANLHRRHLTPSQRNMTGALADDLLARLRDEARERIAEAGRAAAPGRPAEKASVPVRDLSADEARPPQDRKTAAQVAKLVGGSASGVEKAARVKREAPDLVPKVMAGQITVKEAEREVKQRIEQQRASIPALDAPATPSRETLALYTDKGDEVLYPKPKNPPKFNAQDGSEIGWAMYSWNPVTGCRHTCSYCYARALATKPGMQSIYPVGFTPLFHYERLACPANTPVPERAGLEPAYGRVFVCSMADLFGAWVPQDWIDQVAAATVANPQWEYLFLTKYPQRYDRLVLPPSAWIGASIDEQQRVGPTLAALHKVSGVKAKWLSLEPLLEPVKIPSLEGIDWIVIGAQSANPGQNDAFAPDFEWVADLVATARRDGCRVWLKTNLLGEVKGQWPGMKLPNEIPQ
jgi:protein gp37/ParB-like chromosome segregation protein Spo0J